MDTLHSVLRSLRGEMPPRRDHLDVFREFLDHLDRIGRRPQRSTGVKSAKHSKGNGRRGRK